MQAVLGAAVQAGEAADEQAQPDGILPATQRQGRLATAACHVVNVPSRTPGSGLPAQWLSRVQHDAIAAGLECGSAQRDGARLNGCRLPASLSNLPA